MARDGSGNYTRPVSDYVFEATISETDMNTEMGQVATALTDSLTANGEKKWSGNQDANSAAKIINFNQGSARTDSLRIDQVQDGDFNFAGTASGTDTITASLSPAITAYVTGMRVWFISAGANTGAATLNLNSVGAKSIVDSEGNALAANAITSGVPVFVVYDGTADKFFMLDIAVLTTKGDLFTYGTSRARLAVGTAGQRLNPDTGETTGLKWENQEPTLAKATTYSVVAADQGKLLTLSGASFTVTLLAAATAGDGFRVGFKHEGTSGSQQYTIDGNVAETIDGSTTKVLSVSDEVVWLVCDGSGWLVESETYPSGSVIQVVNTTDNAVATGTTKIPFDDSIPQITEGDEYMTRAITPTNSSNILLIESVVCGAVAASVLSWAAALFQDSTADALAAVPAMIDGANPGLAGHVSLRHYMTAGTTSATTFRIRAGVNTGGGTFTFNGSAGSRLFGGVISSNITITEIKA